jgi:hypothetical protein
MGQDIHGWVEIGSEGIDRWLAVVDVGALVERNRTFWTWMFQDRGEFPSVAAGRGVPDDVSETVKQELETLKPHFGTADFHSLTWVAWEEIEAIDWAAGPQPGPLGTPREAVYRNVHISELDAEGVHHSTIERRALRTRRDTLNGYPGWELLFDVMRQLAHNYRPEYVRMVVWFDG